jgi:glutaredoxin
MAGRVRRNREMISPLGAADVEEPASQNQGSRLTLLRRDGCHLCDELARELKALGIAFDTVDVDQDTDLARRYGEAVPVLFQGAEELGRAPFTPEILRAVVSSVMSTEGPESRR